MIIDMVTHEILSRVKSSFCLLVISISSWLYKHICVCVRVYMDIYNFSLLHKNLEYFIPVINSMSIFLPDIDSLLLFNITTVNM